MSDDGQIVGQLGVETLPSVDKAIKKIETLGDSVDDLSAGLTDVSRTAKLAGASVDTFGAERLQASALSPKIAPLPKIGGGAASAPNAAAGTDFGKAQGGLSALGGAASALGGEAGAAAGQVLGLSSQVPAAAKGIQELTSSMSLMGGVIGIAIVATVAVGAAALHEFNKEAKETAERVNKIKDAQIAYNEALDLTSDSIENQIDQNEKLLKTNLANQEATQAAIEALDEPTDIFFKIGDGLGFVGDAGDKLDDELKALEGTESDLTTSTEGLTDALDSAEVAANDAREALLDSVDSERELSKFRRDAIEGDAESNQKRLQAIQDERSDIEASIATLQASGDASKEVQDEIKSLTAELGELDSQAQVLNSSVVKAAEAQKALAEISEEVAEATEEVAKAQKKVTSLEAERTKIITDNTNEQIQESAQGAAEISEIRTQGAADYSELLDTQQQDEIKAEQDKEKTLAKIRDDAFEDEKDASNSFRFLDVFNIRKQAGRNIKAAEQTEAERRQVRLQGDIQERADLAASIVAEREQKIEAIEDDFEQQAIKLQQDIMNKNRQIAEEQVLVNKAVSDKMRVLNKQAQAEVDLASEVGNIQIKIMSQVADTAQQVQRSITSSLSGINSAISTTNNNVTNNFSNRTAGTGMTEADVAQMIAGSFG